MPPLSWAGAAAPPRAIDDRVAPRLVQARLTQIRRSATRTQTNRLCSSSRRRHRLAGMSAEQVALIPQCAECHVVWLPTDETRWSALHTDDEPPGLAFFCPSCAEREFGDEA